jgi:hypothetical protein
MRIGFIGTGAVGTTLARALDGAGVPVVAVASRSFDSASRLAGELRDCTAWEDPQAVVDASDLVFLTVPDDSIDEVCRGLCWAGATSRRVDRALSPRLSWWNAGLRLSKLPAEHVVDLELVEAEREIEVLVIVPKQAD